MSAIRRMLAAAFLSVTLLISQAQSGNDLPKKEKPYKVLTAGKRLTIKSNKTIQHVMLWTTDGNRVVEQKDINRTSVVIDVPISRSAFYLMVYLANGEVFTEKIGVQ